jgi:hypothetical protein
MCVSEDAVLEEGNTEAHGPQSTEECFEGGTMDYKKKWWVCALSWGLLFDLEGVSRRNGRELLLRVVD